VGNSAERLPSFRRWLEEALCDAAPFFAEGLDEFRRVQQPEFDRLMMRSLHDVVELVAVRFKRAVGQSGFLRGLRTPNSAGAAKRTVERLFKEDVGIAFGKWRQQLRLMHAMRLLAEGVKVSHAALEAGYGSPSAFIFMFNKTLGTTPAAYFRMSGIGAGDSDQAAPQGSGAGSRNRERP
jgi:AraC-like DNA-binding protein